jgi:hypothetical protein
MEPAGWLLCSQEPIPRQINSVHTQFIQYLLKYYPPICAYVNPSALFSSPFPTKIVYAFLTSPTRVACNFVLF